MQPPNPPDYFQAAFPTGLWARLSRYFADNIVPPYLRFRLRFQPAYYSWLLKKDIILGFDLVQEAFTRSDALPVPHDFKTTALGWNPPFLLARRDDDQSYRDIHASVREHWSTNRISKLRDIARDAFESNLNALGGRPFDAIHEYMIPGFLEIIENYYGVKIHDTAKESDFVHAQFVISSFFFGDPRGKESLLPHAQAAFAQAMGCLQDVINDANRPPAAGAQDYAGAASSNVLRDLIADGVANDDIKSWLLGMILGFIPTSTNGQGRILDVLMRRPEAMQWARNTVATVGHDKAFLAVCHEALRLNYILPGLFRIAPQPVVLGKGTKWPVVIDADSDVVLSTQTAMFDRRRFDKPLKFDPTRSFVKYLNYGHQMHFCVGWDISDIVMEETFRALVLKKVSRPSGSKHEWRGSFPWRYDVVVKA